MRKIKLKASTLIEIIVASIIMLIAFGATMETATRLTVSKEDGYTLIDVDYRIKECLSEYADGRHQNGTFSKEFDWGKITTRLSTYRSYDKLQEITITAKIASPRKHIIRKYIIDVNR